MCKYKIEVGDTVRVDNLPADSCRNHARFTEEDASSVFSGKHKLGLIDRVIGVNTNATSGNYWATLGSNKISYFFDDLTVIKKGRYNGKNRNR
jgi:hypothetical protein